jgi:hypothetical protein
MQRMGDARLRVARKWNAVYNRWAAKISALKVAACAPDLRS